MKTLILAAIRCSLMFVVPTVTYGISAQWNLNGSFDWNSADNWTPNVVPNGPADIATFGLSNQTFVQLSADTEVNSIIFTPAATNPYAIAVGSIFGFAMPHTLTLSGAGIINNSGITQTFFASPFEIGGKMVFTNSASAGNDVEIIQDTGGVINFFDRSTASSAHISSGEENANSVNFFNRSTASNAVIHYGGLDFISFHDNSTADSATLLGGIESLISFFGHSSAGNATIIGDLAGTDFFFGGIKFFDSSTAGRANIQGNGTLISFSGSSKGGTAAIGLNFSNLDISGHNAPGVTIGSLEGDETSNVFLGANNLTIGSNHLSTTFSGVIQGTGGSLTKIGTGTFELTGANTYTGDTNVNRGVLQVDGSITSNTFVNRGSTLAGTGTISGNVTNGGKVSPGSAGVPGMLTVTGNYTQAQYAALMIQLAGANAGEFSVLNILGTANLSGQLKPLLLNGFLPTVGESFTFLQYGAVNGTLFMFNRNIDNLPEHWEVSYFPTFAVLTVAAGNVPVPDQASTLLLLMLGLSALLMCRRHLVCKQT